jgi:hypothetical protein
MYGTHFSKGSSRLLTSARGNSCAIGSPEDEGRGAGASQTYVHMKLSAPRDDRPEIRDSTEFNTVDYYLTCNNWIGLNNISR